MRNFSMRIWEITAYMLNGGMIVLSQDYRITGHKPGDAYKYKLTGQSRASLGKSQWQTSHFRIQTCRISNTSSIPLNHSLSPYGLGRYICNMIFQVPVKLILVNYPSYITYSSSKAWGVFGVKRGSLLCCQLSMLALALQSSFPCLAYSGVTIYK